MSLYEIIKYILSYLILRPVRKASITPVALLTKDTTPLHTIADRHAMSLHVQHGNPK